jgi:hypothetical protein
MIDTLKLRPEWDREVLKRDTQIPMKQWAYRDVVFGAADTETDVSNPFPREPPAQVRWLVVAVSPAATVYRAAPPDQVAWTSATLWLRATAACTARVLFFMERN